MVGRLVRTKATYDHKDKEYVGYAPDAPLIGECFLFYYSKGNDSVYLRTSPVKEVSLGDHGFDFDTANSSYSFKHISPKEFFNVQKTGAESRS